VLEWELGATVLAGPMSRLQNPVTPATPSAAVTSGAKPGVASVAAGEPADW
jgi:hypothetical protein